MVPKCPKCESDMLSTEEIRFDNGYPVKLVTCGTCGAVLGATLPGFIVQMIEFVYHNVAKLT